MSFWKLSVFLSNFHFTRLTFTFFLIPFISLPVSSYLEETNLRLQQHLILKIKKTITLEKTIDVLRIISKNKENFKILIDLQRQFDRLNPNFDSRATNLSFSQLTINMAKHPLTPE
jgi:hypothetical protein